jgi:hypothetical protein
MTDLMTYRPHARINHGRWVVDCASPLCASAMAPGPPALDGSQRVWPGLTVGQSTMTCRDCGHVTGGVVWPPDTLGIEVVLSWRPDPETRNWEPGETITGLLEENVAHGVPVPGVAALDGDCTLLREVDGVVTGGHVGRILEQLAGPGNRPQIGA